MNELRQGNPDIEELSRRWATAREQLKCSFPPNPTSLWLIDPAMGPLSLEQGGRFLVSHLKYHLKRWPAKNVYRKTQ